MRKLTWVDDPKMLNQAVEEAAEHSMIALDAEMDSYFSYYTKLCLVQMSAGDHDFLIDPLMLDGLEPLNRLTKDPSICKVFHAGENDVPYFRAHGVEFSNIFDTHVAAKILELDSKSLGGLVEIYFDVDLPKDQSRADWRLRPLPDEQVAYARQDTMYLCELAEKLQQELAEDSAAVEASHLFASLESLELREKEFDSDGWAKIKGARDLSGTQRSALKELYIWRERLAEKEDLAVFRVAHNGALISLARKRFTKPEQLRGWAKSRTFKDHADTLVACLERGRERGDIPFPSRGKKLSADWSQADQELFDKLRTWRNEESKKLEIDPSRVFSNRQLKKVVRSKPSKTKDLSRLDGVDDWKVEQYGKTLLEVLKQNL